MTRPTLRPGKVAPGHIEQAPRRSGRKGATAQRPSATPELEDKPVLTPPQMPQSKGLPAGKLSPIQTQEDRDAWAKFHADTKAYEASLFDLERLQQIVADAGAPALLDTPNTKRAVFSIALEMANRRIPVSPSLKEASKRIAKRDKAWRHTREETKKLIASHRWRITWYTERPYYGAGTKEYLEGELEKLKALSIAMDNVEGHFLSLSRETPNKQRRAAILNPNVVISIFSYLSLAWEEAQIQKPSKETRYKIVQSCLAFMGDSVDAGTIKKRIGKALNKAPWLDDLAAYQEMMDKVHAQNSNQEE